MKTKEEILKEYDNMFGENHHKICIGKNCECHKVVKQFISDIRKRDMEALIEKFNFTHDSFASEREEIIRNYYEN